MSKKKYGTDGLPMFDQAPAYARGSDPDTSHEAAASMDVVTVSKLQLIVLRAVHSLGGSGITEEVVEVSGNTWRTITPRFRPLVRMGFLSTPGKRKSPTTNRPQTIWATTEQGRDFLEIHALTPVDGDPKELVTSMRRPLPLPVG